MTTAFQEIVDHEGAPASSREDLRNFLNDLSAHIKQHSDVVLFDEQRARRERDWGILSHQVVGNESFK